MADYLTSKFVPLNSSMKTLAISIWSQPQRTHTLENSKRQDTGPNPTKSAKHYRDFCWEGRNPSFGGGPCNPASPSSMGAWGTSHRGSMTAQTFVFGEIMMGSSAYMVLGVDPMVRSIRNLSQPPSDGGHAMDYQGFFFRVLSLA